MPIAPHRMELEVALRDQPFASKPGDDLVPVEGVREHFSVYVTDAVDLARESAIDQPRRGEPHETRVPGEDVAYRGTIEQGLAARRHAHRRRHVQKLAHLRG